MRLFEDIEVFRRRDPAATTTLSVMINSLGMRAIRAYRRLCWLWTHGMCGLARALSTRSRRKFGVEIHPGATIGRRFTIDHGRGIVIGETTIIGDDCMLYQGVTLGGTGKETGKRHPTFEGGVRVSVGASVLGKVTLGHGSKVGGGAVVVREACSKRGTEREIDEKIEQYTHERRRVFLPDPLDQTVNALAECVAVLEKRLVELKAATGSVLLALSLSLP